MTAHERRTRLVRRSTLLRIRFREAEKEGRLPGRIGVVIKFVVDTFQAIIGVVVPNLQELVFWEKTETLEHTQVEVVDEPAERELKEHVREALAAEAAEAERLKLNSGHRSNNEHDIEAARAELKEYLEQLAADGYEVKITRAAQVDQAADGSKTEHPSNPIELLGLDRRVVRVLSESGVQTIDRLVELGQTRVRGLPGVGEVTVRKIRVALEAKGITWAE